MFAETTDIVRHFVTVLLERALPELPEVETTRRGIAPHSEGKQVKQLVIRDPRLRWPVPDDLPGRLVGQTLRRRTDGPSICCYGSTMAR